MTSTANITQLLIKWRNGDRAALDELLPQVYSELRRLANYYLSRERPGHTLQPTALVHEAYLRLVDDKEIDWQNRAHFFGIAAVRMRHILVEHARSRQAAKRGGGEYKLSLGAADHLAESRDVNLLALDDALQHLEALDPSFALAHAGLADASTRIFFGADTDKKYEEKAFNNQRWNGWKGRLKKVCHATLCSTPNRP